MKFGRAPTTFKISMDTGLWDGSNDPEWHTQEDGADRYSAAALSVSAYSRARSSRS